MAAKLSQRQMKMLELERERIVAFLLEYFEKFNKPAPMKALSIRFRTHLYNWGSTFRETLTEMHDSGRVQIILNEDGSRSVLPGLKSWIG